VSKKIQSIFLALLCAVGMGCQTTSDGVIAAVTALANAPQIAPVTFKVTISTDRRYISFIPILRNFGFDDAKQAFDVRMSVTRTSPQAPGLAPKSAVTQREGIIIPGSTVLTGHHGADVGGLEVQGPPMVGGMPYDPLAIYDVTIIVDEQRTAFGGANEAVSSFAWTGVIGASRDSIFIANQAISDLPDDATGWRCNDVPVPDDVWGFRFPNSVHPNSNSVCLQTALGGPFYIQQFRRLSVDDAVCTRGAGPPAKPPCEMEGWRVCRDPGPLNRGNPPGASPEFKDKPLPCPKVTTGPNGCAPCLTIKRTTH